MSAKRMARTIVLSFVVLCLHLALAACGFAQAWVPPKGEGDVSFTYQNLVVRRHLTSLGKTGSPVRIHSHAMFMGFEYGITDRMALSADLAYIAARYKGPKAESEIDNNSYHPTFQDARIELRYNALKEPLVITPFIGVTIPTHDYETVGHSAVGRGFHEFLLGVNAGRQLWRDGYAQVRYSYAILSHFKGYNLNRSNADWEVGWLATKRLTPRFLGSWQKTYGGLNFPDDVTEETHEIHDRTARANYIRLGGGITFSVNRSLDLHAAYQTTVTGINTHDLRGMTIGVSWRILRGSSLAQLSPDPSQKQIATIGQATY